jgi:hypothetical protein
LIGIERHRVECRIDFRRPLTLANVREVRVLDHLEDAIGLVDRVVGAEWILKDPLDMPVVLLERMALERHDVGAVELDRPFGHGGKAQDHPSDGRLPASALSDQRDDLAGLNIEGDVADRGQPLPAEGTDAVDLGAVCELDERAHAATFQQAT